MIRRHWLLTLLGALVTAASCLPADAQDKPRPVGGVPVDWVEPSGHRVIRLTGDGGGSSFYFHQNAYTATGDKMVISTRGGLATLDLTTLGKKTPKMELVVEGKAGGVVVGK